MTTRQTIALAAGGVLLLAGLAAVPVLAGHGHGKEGHGHDGSHGHSWEGFAERHDTDGDGAVSRAEWDAMVAERHPEGAPDRAAEHFQKLDQDGDGAITEADLTALRSAHLAAFLSHVADGDDDGDLTAAELDAWFAARDTTGDGRLDLADFEGEEEKGRMHRHHHRVGEALDADGDGGVEPSELREVIARFDADRDGTLSEAERPEVAMRHMRHGRGFGHRGGHGAHGEMLRKIDGDGDGTITRAEWDAAVAAHHPEGAPDRAAEHFEKLDTNGDGVLTGDELPERRLGKRRGR